MIYFQCARVTLWTFIIIRLVVLLLHHAIINLATEIKDTFMRTLKGLLLVSSEIDLRKVFPPATQAVTDLVANKIVVINSLYK